ncbi:MAG: hypothetical protein C0402_01735 [Thermodesulfovibrio sp.]|nr:hypothetical protein [Thermodesulfovibrio sp.]
MKKNIFLLLFLTIVLSACSSEKAPPPLVIPGQEMSSGQVQPGPGTAAPGQVSSGEYELIVNPADADTNATLYLGARGFNPVDAKIEWLVNSAVPYPGETSVMLKAGIAKKGYTVQAKATLKDKEIKSNMIKIKNAPPVISRVKLMPEVFKSGDLLSVEVSGTDPDGDTVTFLYEWTKNGQPAGNGRVMDSQVKKGDKVLVKITPFDGEVNGRAGTLNNEIRNMPPMLIDNRDYKFDGRVLTHQARATDPDGDPITYSLKNAPQGMAINSSSGLTTWTVPPGLKDKGSYTVVAKDPNGGESSQLFNYDLGQ